MYSLTESCLVKRIPYSTVQYSTVQYGDRWQPYCGGPWKEEGRVLQSGDKGVSWESLSVKGGYDHESVVCSLKVGKI